MVPARGTQSARTTAVEKDCLLQGLIGKMVLYPWLGIPINQSKEQGAVFLLWQVYVVPYKAFKQPRPLTRLKHCSPLTKPEVSPDLQRTVPFFQLALRCFGKRERPQEITFFFQRLKNCPVSLALSLSLSLCIYIYNYIYIYIYNNIHILCIYTYMIYVCNQWNTHAVHQQSLWRQRSKRGSNSWMRHSEKPQHSNVAGKKCIQHCV